MGEKDRKETAEVEIPVGLLHPAMLEPFRVRFFVEDELITDCEITLDPYHKGIERIMEGMPVEKGLIITERICGICSHIHLWNGTRAVERGLKIKVPERADSIRVIMAELERLHSHLIFLAHAMEVLGHETMCMRAFTLREDIMDLLYIISGNRVHYAVPILGGVRPRCDIDEYRLEELKTRLSKLKLKIGDYANRVINDSMIMSRVKGTGVLTKEEAIKYATPGPTGRASGLDVDLRKKMKEYKNYDFDVIVLDDGDVKDRVVARALESIEAVKIIEQALEHLPPGPVSNRSFDVGEMKSSISYIEAPRGEIYDSCSLDETGRIRNYQNRTPTLTAMASMEIACIGDQLTDGMLTVASCDPCLACTNRAIVVENGKERIITQDDVKSLIRRGLR
ncbi:MAG: hypothetical protein GYA60_01470 [Candidatus Methanofastidiosa archaeon]|nr:hypothetical protein [Candidatus Methanofastidiosa archaeon]